MELVEEGGYKFTIAYTTYNRKDLITRRLNSLLTMNIPGNVEIIIVDNASSDGTFQAISDLIDGTEVKVYRNNENLGFSGNFVETIRRAKGDYVMWSSDKDEVDLSGVQSLLDWIGSEMKPDLVVLNYYRKMKLKSHHPSTIRKNKTKVIKYGDLWSCSHLPGIVWNRSVTLANLDDWSEMKKAYPETSRYYPQLLLMIKITPYLNSYFFDGHIAYQKDYADFSYHAATSGEHFSHLASRWSQHKELINLIEACIREEKNINHKKYLYKMDKSLNRNLYEFVSTAIREERPGLHAYLSNSCSPSYLIRRNYKLLKLVYKSFLDSPLLTIHRIKKRLKIKYRI